MPSEPRSRDEWRTLNWLRKQRGSEGLDWDDSRFPIEEDRQTWVIADGFLSDGPALRLLGGRQVPHLFYEYKPLIDSLNARACAFSYFQPSGISGFGYGPRNTAKSLEEAVSLIQPYLSRRHDQKVAYIGFSFGGLILLVGLAAALLTERVTPGQVGSLILVQPPLDLANVKVPSAGAAGVAGERTPLVGPTADQTAPARASGEPTASEGRISDVRTLPPIIDFVHRRQEIEALVESSAAIVASRVRTVAVVWEGDQFAPYQPQKRDKLTNRGVAWHPIPDYKPSDSGVFEQHAEVSRHESTLTDLAKVLR
jgi:pimeloyl-ACP methyl ester carboxylesterase